MRSLIDKSDHHDNGEDLPENFLKKVSLAIANDSRLLKYGKKLINDLEGLSIDEQIGFSLNASGLRWTISQILGQRELEPNITQLLLLEEIAKIRLGSAAALPGIQWEDVYQLFFDKSEKDRGEDENGGALPVYV